MAFTLEEIYLIRNINSKKKDEIIYELKMLRKNNTDPDIVEIAVHALAKLRGASDKMFSELMNYPL